MNFSNCEYLKQEISHFKDCDSTYEFDSCTVGHSKVRDVVIDNIHIQKCNAEDSRFTDVELTFGSGIHDNQVKNCKFQHLDISHILINQNSIDKSSIVESYFLRNEMKTNLFREVKADDISFATLQVGNNRFDDMELLAMNLLLTTFENNRYKDVVIDQARIRKCRFVGEEVGNLKCSNAKFQDCNFADIDFREATFDNCIFEACQFADCMYTTEQKKLFGVE